MTYAAHKQLHGQEKYTETRCSPWAQTTEPQCKHAMAQK